MKKHLLSRAVAAAILGISLGLASGAASQERLNLPQMGEPADLVMSPSDEKHIGRGYMRKIRQYLDLVTDTEINRYIQTLGDRLVATRSDLDDVDFTFLL